MHLCTIIVCISALGRIFVLFSSIYIYMIATTTVEVTANSDSEALARE